MRDPVEREFLLAFWKIHILHHAGEERGVYGQWMLQELHRHGYRISPGTLYPILARMAERGWLRASEPKRSRDARVYHLTLQGDAVLARLRAALDELYGEAGARRLLAQRRTSPQPATHRAQRRRTSKTSRRV